MLVQIVKHGNTKIDFDKVFVVVYNETPYLYNNNNNFFFVYNETPYLYNNNDFLLLYITKHLILLLTKNKINN